MGVPFPALLCCVCVCVFYFLIVFYLHCSVALLFCICALKRSQMSSGVNQEKKLRVLLSPSRRVGGFLPGGVGCCAASPPQTHIGSTRRQCLLSEVTARTLTRCTAERSPSATRFLPSPFPCFSCVSVSPPLRERNTCRRPEGDALNTSSF